MIDIDKIESQCNAAIQNGYGHLPVIECGNAAKVSELIGMLRLAERDAERWRKVVELGSSGQYAFCEICSWDYLEVEDLTSFIDEAIGVNQD